MQVLCLSDVEPSPVLPGLELLHFLTSTTARVFTREKLLDEVWGGDYFGGIRTVDVHVRRLRAKLGEHEALISTVRGVGYGFDRANLNASLSTELNIEETQ